MTQKTASLFTTLDELRHNVVAKKEAYWAGKTPDAQDKLRVPYIQAKRDYYAAIDALSLDEIREYGLYVHSQK